MKQLLVIFISCLITSFAHSQETEKKVEQPQLKDKKEQLSYSIGFNVGQNVSDKKITLNHEYFLVGLKDGLANKTSLMTTDEIKKVMNDLQNELVQKHVEEMKAKSEKNLADGEKFLKSNKKKKGIITLPSGLQYRVINPGKGESPKATDMVTTNYRGKLLDGTEFDSSYAREKPVTIPVNGVIPGWSEALKLMQPGAKWELFIPAKLAYGDQAPNPVIGPNACLTFEVELLSVEKPSMAQEAATQGEVDPAGNQQKDIDKNTRQEIFLSPLLQAGGFMQQRHASAETQS